jgi:hypothetical protein
LLLRLGKPFCWTWYGDVTTLIRVDIEASDFHLAHAQIITHQGVRGWGQKCLLTTDGFSEVPNPQVPRSSLWRTIRGTKRRVLLWKVRWNLRLASLWMQHAAVSYKIISVSEESAVVIIRVVANAVRQQIWWLRSGHFRA